MIGAVAKELKRQGFDVDETKLAGQMWEAYGREFWESFGPMAIISAPAKAIGGARLGHAKLTGKTAAYDAAARENAETVRQAKRDFGEMDKGTYEGEESAQAARKGRESAYDWGVAASRLGNAALPEGERLRIVNEWRETLRELDKKYNVKNAGERALKYGKQGMAELARLSEERNEKISELEDRTLADFDEELGTKGAEDADEGGDAEYEADLRELGKEIKEQTEQSWEREITEEAAQGTEEAEQQVEDAKGKAERREAKAQLREAEDDEAIVNRRVMEERRTRFDKLASPEVSSEEVRNIPRGEGFVQRVLSWVQSKNIFGQHTNKDTGWDNIGVSKKSVKSVVKHDGKDVKVALLEKVPELINDGIYLETTTKNNDGLISHIFAGKATIDGVPYAVSYVVREDVNGRRYYDHNLTKIEALDRVDNQAPDVSQLVGTYHAGKESSSNILKKHLGVNTQDKKIFSTP